MLSQPDLFLTGHAVAAPHVATISNGYAQTPEGTVEQVTQHVRSLFVPPLRVSERGSGGEDQPMSRDRPHEAPFSRSANAASPLRSRSGTTRMRLRDAARRPRWRCSPHPRESDRGGAAASRARPATVPPLRPTLA